MRYLVNRPTPANRSLDPVHLVNDFDRMLDTFFGDLTWPRSDSRLPRVDIKREEGQYILSADLPGYSEKDLDLKIEGNLLTISGEAREEKEEDSKKFLLRERTSSSFKRSFVLPEDVDTEKIEASFKDGVLNLSLKQSEKVQARTISIKKD
ncbi:MAG: Hsp20/alpha crystallin family protein [Spirochaetales bacterium]|jgi:HSP20 family protein|nr:Hsp20/alpha crystallin family protein [Spirochaetales bacterium]